MIVFVALCLMLFGMPDWLVNPHVVVAQQKHSNGELTVYRVTQLELSNKTMNEKQDMMILGLQHVNDRLDTIDKRTDDTRWWIGVVLAAIGTLTAMKAPEALERWRKR